MTKLIARSTLSLLSLTQLVAVFNDASEAYSIGTVVKKFADKQKAVKRVEDVMDKHDLHLGRRDNGTFMLMSRLAYDELIANGAEEVELTAEEVAAGAPADEGNAAGSLAAHVEGNKQKKTKKAKEPSTGKRGRTAGYAGKLLRTTVAESPHNNGSARDTLFKLVAANPGTSADSITDVASLSYELRKGYFEAYDATTGEAMSADEALAEGQQQAEEAQLTGEEAAAEVEAGEQAQAEVEAGEEGQQAE